MNEWVEVFNTLYKPISTTSPQLRCCYTYIYNHNKTWVVPILISVTIPEKIHRKKMQPPTPISVSMALRLFSPPFLDTLFVFCFNSNFIWFNLPYVMCVCFFFETLIVYIFNYWHIVWASLMLGRIKKNNCISCCVFVRI